MFTKSDIAKAANPKSFERGKTVATSADDIIARKVEFLGDSAEISASVKSASGISEYFHSCIVTDTDLDTVIGYECTCPAATRFSTMCKHCVALGVSFLASPQSYSGYEADRSPKTSRSIARFLQQTPIETSSKSATVGGISIDTELYHDFGNWSAQFKCRCGSASYVIGDLAAFAQAIRRNTFMSYGKKLGFRHSLSAFDDASKEIAKLILRAVDLRQSLSEGTRMLQTPSIKRALPLTETETVDLLDAIGDGVFRFEDKATSKTLFNAGITDADPDLKIRFLEQPGDGFLIMRDDDFIVAASSGRMYVFLDDAVYRCSPEMSEAADFLESVYLSDDETLFLATDDAPLFCATALPSIEGAVDIVIPKALEDLKPLPGKVAYYFDLIRVGRKEIITVEIRVAYGEAEYVIGYDEPVNPSSGIPDADADNPAADSNKAHPLRDEALENRAIAALRGVFDMSFQLPVEDEEKVGILLFGGLEALQDTGDVFTTPAFDRLLTSRTPTVQLGLSIEGNLLNMDIQPTDMEKDELAALLKSYRRKKRFHRLKSGAFLSLQDMELKHFSAMADELGLDADDIAKGKISMPEYRAFLLDREYSYIFREDSFSSYVDCFKEVDQESFEVPVTLKDVLRPYQVEGFRWLSSLSELGFGGILADEMGLGKTLQVISLLLSLFQNGKLGGPVLIVCPASLVFNWDDEFRKFASELSVAPVEGLKIERNRIRRNQHIDVFITSYDIARIDAEAFSKMEFSYVILDEAQYIKNHTTKTSRAIKSLNGRHRLALTGTPIENRLSEIWSIFDFLMPGFLGTYAYFMQRYESGILGGDEECASRLQALVGPFILRRLKSTVLTELPDKMESVIHVPLTDEQSKLYNANEQELRESLNLQKRHSSSRAVRRGTATKDSGPAKIEVLAELTRLRQIALDPSLVYQDYTGGASKAQAIVELIEQAMDTGQKSLVFSQFTSYLEILQKELTQRKIPFHLITGATPKQERIDLVNAFNADDTPVFFVSLKAGGTGLNLTGASVVIHADPWWNAAAVNQATDRAHRIGQEKHVNVYKIIAKETIEERIEALQEKKTQLADSIIKQVDAVSLASLTKDELEYLLSGE